MICLLLCCLAALGQGALSYEYRIHNANELIQFSRNVSSGTSYNGTTVFLDADIDFSGGFSEQLEPIGMNSNYYFRGTFDGQGYTISNLAINSSSQYVGLFGRSEGATIRNIVLDSSCSVVSSYNGSSYAYAGGVIGWCKDCTVENTVNMGSVAFTGNTRNYLYIGGIVGYLYTLNNEAILKNCANYGSVTHSGTASDACIGGIAGYSRGSSSKYIQNSLNYGTINHSETTSGSLYIGGILGEASTGINKIENCVSGGRITSSKGSIGSIIGSAGSSSSTTITQCYWTSDVGCNNTCGSGNPTITESTIFSTTTMDSLNSYNSSWSKWFMLYLNGGSINNLNQKSLVVAQKHFPDPVKEGHTFLFWCLDTECNEKYDPNATNTDNQTLVAQWTANNYTVSFDQNGGTVDPQTMNVTYNSLYSSLPTPTKADYVFLWWFIEGTEPDERIENNTVVTTPNDHTLVAVWDKTTVTLNPTGGSVSTTQVNVTYGQNYPELPEPNKAGHTFLGWFENETGGNIVTNTTNMTRAFDHTLYAQWTVNNYTITFDYINGTVVNETLKYNETINYPENLTREGYTFNEWKPEPKRMPAEDTTVVAQWTKIHSSSSHSSSFISPLFSSSSSEITSEFVEIVLGAKDMTQEQVKEALKKFTDEDFVIKRFDVDKKTGETTVIIKFSEPEKAKDFVRNVNKARESSEWSVIKKAGFIAGNSLSAATKAETGFFTVLLALTIF